MKWKHACQQQSFPSHSCSSRALTRCQLGVSMWCNERSGMLPTSRITVQMSLTHWITESWFPDIVTPRSVELGSKSPATCIWAPVLCKWWGGLKKRLSLILEIRQVVITLPWLLSVPSCWLYWPYIFPPILRETNHGIVCLTSSPVRLEITEETLSQF